jgi:hypothetical protein
VPRGEPYFQVALIVPSLDDAMRELEATLGLTFWEPLDREIGPWAIRVAFSREGPPFLELTEGQPGSPWDPTGAPRVDHIGWWTRDIDTDAQALEEAGAPVEVDGRPHDKPFTYHRGPATGIRYELVGVPPSEIYARWQLKGDPPPN